MAYYENPVVAVAPPRSVEIIETKPPVKVFGYHYTKTSLTALILAIVIMIIAIVIIIWLIHAGITVTNQVVVHGDHHHQFPMQYTVAIVLAIIVLIVAIIIIIWVINIARKTTHAGTSMTRMSPPSSFEVSASAPIYRSPGYI